ncbi:hypothetical protein F2Q69_00015408 [Brassica cretica]|uniref:Uncharacterized protein n=1 Tax=Brassica cretica TaxID=69181 RepID=A0A8S9QZ89_BRACR|nr:hypothetical protein F2Q69_00015408 [Brassica cretica]
MDPSSLNSHGFVNLLASQSSHGLVGQGVAGHGSKGYRWIPRKREADEVMKWVPSPKNNIQTLEAEAKGLSDQVDRLTGEVYNLTVQKFLCWRSSASTNKQRYRVGKRLEVTGGMVL